MQYTSQLHLLQHQASVDHLELTWANHNPIALSIRTCFAATPLLHQDHNGEGVKKHSLIRIRSRKGTTVTSAKILKVAIINNSAVKGFELTKKVP